MHTNTVHVPGYSDRYYTKLFRISETAIDR
jgi:hypothetical protein